MRKLIILWILLSSVAAAGVEDESQFECRMFGKEELLDNRSPSFDGFKVPIESTLVPAPLNLESNPLARTYRTALRHGMKSGPNFAGHYALVVWGCGTSCSGFAVADLKNGNVFSIPGFVSLSGVHVREDAQQFLSEGTQDSWGYRHKLSSNLLVLVGTINEDDSKQGAFYYAFSDNKFKLIHQTLFRPKCKR